MSKWGQVGDLRGFHPNLTFDLLLTSEQVWFGRKLSDIDYTCN